MDPLELERITKLDAREIRRSDPSPATAASGTRPPLPCPHCGGGQLIRMKSLDRPGTELDSCTVCYGVWADAGELTHVTGADTLGARLRSIFRR